MKSEFLNHVSHEFRTPLTILKTALEMVEMEPEILEMQQAALERLERLVNSVLLLNEINSRGVQLERVLVNSQNWVDRYVRPLLEPDGNFTLKSDLPECTLEFDLFKVNNALEHLIENAAKFGNGRGEISLYLSSRKAVVAGMEAPDGNGDGLESGLLRSGQLGRPDSRDTVLVIEVKDEGIGIPAHELQAIFQPFTQAANSPTRGVRGAGLGLAMAKRIVDAHGGEIFCRSAVEQGTVFYIAIPVHWQRNS